MSTAINTLAPLPLVTKRNRHSVENDLQSALIKRINRRYAKLTCDHKVRIVNGYPVLFDTVTGTARPDFFNGDLNTLLRIVTAP